MDLHCSAQRPKSSMKWFTVHWEGNKKVQDQIFADGKRVNISEENNFTITINDLRESDKNTYCCRDVNDRLNKCQGGVIQLLVAGTVVQLFIIKLLLQNNISALILVVFNILSDLQVKVFPATGEKTVSLMCSSSCPLTESPCGL